MLCRLTCAISGRRKPIRLMAMLSAPASKIPFAILLSNGIVVHEFDNIILRRCEIDCRLRTGTDGLCWPYYLPKPINLNPATHDAGAHLLGDLLAVKGYRFLSPFLFYASPRVGFSVLYTSAI